MTKQANKQTVETLVTNDKHKLQIGYVHCLRRYRFCCYHPW